MRTRFDEAQDLTLWLTPEERSRLLEGPTMDFQEIHTSSNAQNGDGKNYILLKGLCHELGRFIFLGYCRNEGEIFTPQEEITIYTMDQIGRMRVSFLKEDPWYINLSKEGINHFRRGWQFGVRYDGEHKLFIFGETK